MVGPQILILCIEESDLTNSVPRESPFNREENDTSYLSLALKQWTESQEFINSKNNRNFEHFENSHMSWFDEFNEGAPDKDTIVNRIILDQGDLTASRRTNFLVRVFGLKSLL